MSRDLRVLVHPDKASLAASIAARFIGTVAEILSEQSESTVVLTGGSTGIAALAAVNDSPARDSVEWSRVNFWWGDERWLPSGDPERNETQAREALLDHIGVDPTRVHPFPASGVGIDLDAAADLYAAELRAHALEGSGIPRFDLMFLGVGPDGHIASLFPGQAGIREQSRSVVSVRNSPKPPPERLSLTLPVINSSARVWLVMAGADKAVALERALGTSDTFGASDTNEVPASRAHGVQQTVFFVDSAAAVEIPENLTTPASLWAGEDDA